MTAGTCLEHPHHEALLQFVQVPRMHMVVMLFSIAVEGGVGEWRFRGAENGGLASVKQVSSVFVSLAIKFTAQ